jgi:carbamoyl-phosphate synthase large subunit
LAIEAAAPTHLTVARIQLGGAGGAPTNNVIRSLREGRPRDHLIGQSSVSADLLLADVDERYVVPPATAPEYGSVLLELLARTNPDLLHVQHDFEVQAVSGLRDEIARLGVKLFLPAPTTIDRCVDKFASYRVWSAAGLRVPETYLITTSADLDRAFRELGPKVWLRATHGGAGLGALATESPDLARAWIDRFDGWGTFTGATCLTDKSATWLSLWYRGELVVAQGRRRHGWAFASRAPSGVTGITHVATTCTDSALDDAAMAAIAAIDPSPHGIFGVDLTYDETGHPNPTEINIGRFFTTTYFLTRAGLNLPAIYRDLAIDGTAPSLARRVNPLPEGLAWVRGMDVEPVLTTVEELERIGRWSDGDVS